MSEFSHVILVNPSQQLIQNEIEKFNNSHPKDPNVHQVAERNLLQNSFDFTDPFPRIESHGHYLFGEFATPTSLIDGQDLFITTHFIASFTCGLVIFRSPDAQPIDALSQCFTEHHNKLNFPSLSSGRLIIDLISFVVDDYERKIDEVHLSIDTNLLSLTKSFATLGKQVIEIDFTDFYNSASLFNIDVVGCQSSIDGSLQVLSDIADDKIDLRSESISTPNEMFTRDLEIEVSDLQIRVRHLQSLRNNLQSSLNMSFKKFEKIEDLRQTRASHNMTAIASIMLLPSFLVGFFGQNFRVSDELNLQWGWTLSLGLIITVSIGQIVFFRRKNWL